MDYVPLKLFNSVCSANLVSARQRRHPVFLFAFIVVAVFISQAAGAEDEPSNRVSIEEFIDLDETSAPFQTVAIDGNTDVKVVLDEGKGHITNTKTNDVIFDDEELFASGSGSGSGSGDYDVTVMLHQGNGQLTPTEMTSVVDTSSAAPGPLTVDLDAGDKQKVTDQEVSSHIILTGDKNSDNVNNNVDHTFVDNDNDDNNDILEDDSLVIYDLPAASPVTSNYIINPASWAKWSEWFTAGSTSKVRVRTCQVEGQEVNEVACEGVRVQVRSCEDSGNDHCGKIQNVSTLASACGDAMRRVSRDKFLKAPPPPPPVPKAPPIMTKKPDPDVCQYSLFDNFRQKYVFTRWNLTQLITMSKVKRWCDKSSGQYLVMSTPQDHCRRYYKDLCKVSQRCRSNKPAKERGDFAEGCWRNLVYGEMLPIGLSNKQTIVYFICQRFASQSKTGKSFGYKQVHFGTLYDTSIKSPVLSLNKITRLGDDTWPETDFFIEHGLVENENTKLWLFRKPRKGMLTLKDLERCHDDQSCDVGLRQTLPADYQDPRDSGYSHAHLMWPELMPPDPAPRLATFTMTNMAPMHSSLYQEWHDAVRKVRKYAIDECGIPLVLDSNLRHLGEFSSHRANKSAMYLASGIIPSTDPVLTTGHDVHVPFLFWIAGCCVQQHTTQSSNINNNSSSYNNEPESYSWNDTLYEDTKTNITAFSVYIRNAPDNHVISAPILQLEMLLQDIYKTTPTDADVLLFPGHDSVCSDLKNDVSRWFQ